MTVTINGVARRAVAGTEGTVLLVNGSEIEAVVLPSGRVVWTDGRVPPDHYATDMDELIEPEPDPMEALRSPLIGSEWLARYGRKRQPRSPHKDDDDELTQVGPNTWIRF